MSIIVYELYANDDPQTIRRWVNKQACAQKLNISVGSVHNGLNLGKAKGFTFQYTNENGGLHVHAG